MVLADISSDLSSPSLTSELKVPPFRLITFTWLWCNGRSHAGRRAARQYGSAVRRPGLDIQKRTGQEANYLCHR